MKNEKAEEIKNKELYSSQDNIGVLLSNWRNNKVLPFINGELVDIACGDNRLVKLYGKGIGIDIIQYPKTKNVIVVEDVTKLPFDDSSIDTVTIIASLNYFDNPVAVLKEVNRILKNDGQLITTWGFSRFISVIWHLFREPWAKESGFNIKTFNEIIKEAGFALKTRKRFMFRINNILVLKKTRLSQKACFIIGSHRTGTNALADYFKKFNPSMRVYDQFSSLRLLYLISNLFVSKNISEKWILYFTEKILINHIKKSNSNYLLSSGFAYYSGLYSMQFIKDVKILHIIRDPRNFVTSYYNWIYNKKQSYIANKLIPYWNVPLYKLGFMTKSQWKKMDLFERLCWQWKFKNEFIFSTYKECNYLSIKFEDIINTESRVDSLKKTNHFFDLPYNEKSDSFFNTKINASKYCKLSKWSSWDKKKCLTLQKICGESMNQHGYGLEKEWIKIITDEANN